MTAPWGVEFNEHIIFIINDDVFIVVCHDHLNWTFLLLRNGLRLDAWLDLAVNKVLDEFIHIIVGELLGLVEGELLVLDCFLDGEGGPLVRLKVEVAGVSTERFGVNGCEANCSFVFLGERLEGLSQFGALFWGFREDVRERDASL